MFIDLIHMMVIILEVIILEMNGVGRERKGVVWMGGVGGDVNSGIHTRTHIHIHIRTRTRTSVPTRTRTRMHIRTRTIRTAAPRRTTARGAAARAALRLDRGAPSTSSRPRRRR